MKFLKVILSITLILDSNLIYAGEPMSQARAQVAESLQMANDTSLSLIRSDVDKLIYNIMESLLNSPDVAGVRTALLLKNRELEKAFISIGNADAKAIASLELKVDELFANYQKLVRQRFTQSFLPNKARYQAEKVALQIKNALFDFSNQCEVGRSDYSYQFNPNLLPNLPEPYVDYYVKVGTEGTNFEFRGGSINSVDSDLVKDLNSATGTAGAVAGWSSSIAYGGTAAASSTIIPYAAAVAPYAIVVFVALAAITDFISANEQAKLQTEIANANFQLFAYSADDFDVERFYKKNCKSFQQTVKVLIATLNSIIDDNGSHAELLEEAKKSRLERYQWELDSVRRKAANQVMKIVHYYKRGKCLPKHNLANDLLVEATCVSDDDTVYLTGNKAERVQVDDIKSGKAQAEAEKSLKEFAKTYSDEKLITFINHKMVEVIISTNESIELELNTIKWDGLDRAQNVAFQKILRILALLRLNKQDVNNNGQQDIEAELVVQKQFYKLRAEFNDIIAKSLLQLRGRISREEYLMTTKEYLVRAHYFVDQYYHVDAIADFELLLKKLEAINEGV